MIALQPNQRTGVREVALGSLAFRARSLRLASALWAVLVLALCSAWGTDFTAKLAPLIDPAKLATLGQRGANPRIQKAVAILAEAQAGGAKSDEVARRAVERAGYTGNAADLTAAALLRNLDIAAKLGCLDATNLAAMRRGNSPTVRAGPYAGQKAAVDHIIPRAVVPALDNTIANLELLPEKLNRAKSAKVGARQLDLARQLHRAGLLDAAGLAAVERAATGAKQ